MKVIAVANQKGGVGKTTTALTLGHGLAQRGYRVLLVDLDTQGNVACGLGLERSRALYQLIVDEVPVREVIVPSGRENLDVIASDKSVARAKEILAGRSFKEFVLKKALAPVVPNYDFIILDCAPSVDVLHYAAFVAATHLIIPTRLDQFAVVGVVDVLNSIKALGEALQALSGDARAPKLLGIVPTFWDSVTRETREQFENLARHMGKHLLPFIPQDTKLREASACGVTIWEYAPGSRALQGVPLRVQGRPRLVGGYIQLLDRVLHLLRLPARVRRDKYGEEKARAPGCAVRHHGR